MSALQSLTAKLVIAKQEISDNAKEAFKEAFAEFFAQHPSVDAVKWQQYTPYFNDGSPCTFNVNDHTVAFNSISEQEKKDLYVYDDREEDEAFGFGTFYALSYDASNTTPAAKAFKTLKSIFSSGEELFLAAFGDHAEVTVTRAIIEVETYEHD